MVCAFVAAPAFCVQSASAQPACPHVLTYEGDPAWVDAIDAQLRDGLLRSVSAAECAGVVIALEPEGRRIRFRVQRGDHVEAHVTDDPQSAATWIESWLMPVATVAMVEQEPEEERPADPRLVAVADTTAGAATATTTGTAVSTVALEAAAEDERPPELVEPSVAIERRIPVRLDALLSFDADRTAPIWWGGEASVGIELRPKLWFAFAAGAHVAPNVNGETRRAVRLSLRSGWMSRSDATEVRIGLGFGVGYAHAERETVVGGEEVEVADDAALPMVEGYWDVRYALSDHIGLVVGVLLRGNIPDGLNDRKPDSDDEPGEQLEPYPDARASISLRVGLSWGTRP